MIHGTRCTNFEGAKGLKLGFTNLSSLQEIAQSQSRCARVQKQGSRRELRRKTSVVSKPDALRNRRSQSRAAIAAQAVSIRDRASRARHGNTESTSSQPGFATRPIAAIVGRPPAGQRFWEPMIGRMPPLVDCSEGINPAPPHRLPTHCQQMTFML